MTSSTPSATSKASSARRPPWCYRQSSIDSNTTLGAAQSRRAIPHELQPCQKQQHVDECVEALGVETPNELRTENRRHDREREEGDRRRHVRARELPQLSVRRHFH